jgi:hypothetical protein
LKTTVVKRNTFSSNGRLTRALVVPAPCYLLGNRVDVQLRRKTEIGKCSHKAAVATNGKDSNNEKRFKGKAI